MRRSSRRRTHDVDVDDAVFEGNRNLGFQGILGRPLAGSCALGRMFLTAQLKEATDIRVAAGSKGGRRE